MIKSFKGKTPKIAESAYISDGAYIMGDVEIGEGSSVWPGAVIRADLGASEVGGGVKIGKNTHIEDNVVIHFTKEIGDNVIIGHGAVVEAIKIGNNVLVGDNATLLPRSEVGNFCLIAAGSLVQQSMKIPDRSFVAGVPAKVKGSLTAEQETLMKATTHIVTVLAIEHKKEEA